MRRLVVGAALVGAVDGVLAVVALRVLSQGPEGSVGWFAYAPLQDVQPVASGVAWWPAVVVVPVLLALVTATLAWLLALGVRSR